MMERQPNRRQLLQAAAAVSLGSATVSMAQGRMVTARTSPKAELTLGLASYTLRDFKLDDVLAMTKRVDLKYISFKSMHLPLDSSVDHIHEVVQKVKDAGLILYSGGVIYMRTAQQVNQAFDYAKAAGMKVIIGVPQPDLLGLVNEKVKQYDIQVAIHNHGPGDKTYPTPATIYERIKDLDKRIGLCNDIGHTQRSGVDPAASILKYADRLLEIHMKDETEATAKGHGCEIGRGVIDIPKVIRALEAIRFKGVLAFEYEKDPKDPLAGLAESVGYVKGVIAAT